MLRFYRVWVGRDEDPYSGFTFYLVPDVPNEAWKQTDDLLAAMPAFDTAWLFSPENDDDPVYVARCLTRDPVVITGSFHGAVAA